MRRLGINLREASRDDDWPDVRDLLLDLLAERMLTVVDDDIYRDRQRPHFTVRVPDDLDDYNDFRRELVGACDHLIRRWRRVYRGRVIADLRSREEALLRAEHAFAEIREGLTGLQDGGQPREVALRRVELGLATAEEIQQSLLGPSRGE